MSPAAAGLNTRAAANAYCAAQFGNDPAWKGASFHDGGGWNFAAYGNTRTQSPRFWVNIADQPNGNCWGRDPARSSAQRRRGDHGGVEIWHGGRAVRCRCGPKRRP